MKTLKLNHEVAQLVVQGRKDATWRLYDDKDLSVNDVIQLIDKVDAHKPATWRPIGTAHIDSITQKRLGAIEPSDYDNDRAIPTQELLALARQYYGPQVDEQTTVKIIRFTFNHSTAIQDSSGDKTTTNLTEVNMYADGGSRGNPGPSASGFVVTDMTGKVVVKRGEYLGVTTNNQAEYQALKAGLEEAQKLGARTVHVYMDSLLVVNQMLGVFTIKNRDLWPIHTAIKALLPAFQYVSFTHIPRELNKLADAAVNETLDESISR